MIPSPQLGFLRGVFPANHLASIDNLTRTSCARCETICPAPLLPWAPKRLARRQADAT